MKVRNATSAEAATLLSGHYLGGTTYSPARQLIEAHGRAIAVFSYPVASSFKTAIPSALELARLYKMPGADFPTSQFLAAALRWLRTNTKAACVFSYADPAAKNSITGAPHTGAIYRATGFAFLGMSRATDKWIAADLAGETVISAPMAYRRHKTKSREKLQEINPHWRLVEGQQKYLYVFPLHMRLKAIRAKLPRYAACPLDEPVPTGASAARPREAAPHV